MRLFDGRPIELDEFEFYYAYLLVEQGRHERARDILKPMPSSQALRDGRRRARRLILLADVQRVLGEYTDGIATLQSALRCGEILTGNETVEERFRRELLALLADAHGIWSEVLRENGRLVEAAAHLEDSRKLAEQSGLPQAREHWHTRNAELLLVCGDLTRAREWLMKEEEQSLIAANPANQRQNIAWHIGWLRLIRGCAEARLARQGALPHSVARETFEKLVADPETQADFLLTARARLLEQALRRGDLLEAGLQLDKCNDVVQAAFSSQRLRPRSQYAAAAAWLARCQLAAGDQSLASWIGDDDDPWSPIRSAGRAAWRWLAERTLRRFRAELAALVEHERSVWQRLPLGSHGSGFLHLDMRLQNVGELIEVQLELAKRRGRDGAAAALSTVLDLQSCQSLARTRGARCSLAGIRRHVLPPGGGLLVYWPAPSGSHVFTVDDGSVRHFRLASSDVLLDRARVLRDLAGQLSTSGRPSQWRAQLAQRIWDAARAAREQLLPSEVLTVVRSWDTVTVVGADLAGDVCLEMLPLGEDVGSPLLGEVLPIASVPSLAWAEHLARELSERDPRIPGAGNVRVVACVEPMPGAKDVRLSRADLRFLEDSFGRGAVLVGREATRDQILNMDPVDLLHIIAHGKSVNEELRASIMLHDGVLRHDQLAELRALGGTLVFLSVCAAARDGSRVGEGGLGTLGGALLWAGARAVVQSRDDLFLREHLRFLKDFYSSLATEAPATALQRARKAMADEHDLVHRALLAELQIIGLGHRR